MYILSSEVIKVPEVLPAWSEVKSTMAAKLTTSLATLALLLPSANSCLRERSFHSHGLTKRSVTPRAELSSHEQLIIDSFDSQHIDWNSYYYTHGMPNIAQTVHLADTQASKAITSLARTNLKLSGQQIDGQKLV